MNVRLVLRKYFEKKKKSVPGFSMRVLARQLEVSPSFLSRIFSGEKSVPFPLLMKLRVVLDIEPEVFELLREKFDVPTPTKTIQDTNVVTELEDWDLVEKKTFSVLRQWFFLAILEMTTLKNFDGSLDTIAMRLGLSKTVVEIAAREMVSLGLMEVRDDRYFKTKKKLRWSTSKSQEVVRAFHSAMLSKAKEELRLNTSEAEFTRRLITGITLTASPEKIDAAKKRLSEALHEIANDLTDEQGTEVYHLSAQLFPLTK